VRLCDNEGSRPSNPERRGSRIRRIERGNRCPFLVDERTFETFGSTGNFFAVVAESSAASPYSCYTFQHHQVNKHTSRTAPSTDVVGTCESPGEHETTE
jgi:hypothetical protein